MPFHASPHSLAPWSHHSPAPWSHHSTQLRIMVTLHHTTPYHGHTKPHRLDPWSQHTTTPRTMVTPHHTTIYHGDTTPHNPALWSYHTAPHHGHTKQPCAMVTPNSPAPLLHNITEPDTIVTPHSPGTLHHTVSVLAVDGIVALGKVHNISYSFQYTLNSDSSVFSCVSFLSLSLSLSKKKKKKKKKEKLRFASIGPRGHNRLSLLMPGNELFFVIMILFFIFKLETVSIINEQAYVDIYTMNWWIINEKKKKKKRKEINHDWFFSTQKRISVHWNHWLRPQNESTLQMLLDFIFNSYFCMMVSFLPFQSRKRHDLFLKICFFDNKY